MPFGLNLTALARFLRRRDDGLLVSHAYWAEWLVTVALHDRHVYGWIRVAAHDLPSTVEISGLCE